MISHVISSRVYGDAAANIEVDLAQATDQFPADALATLMFAATQHAWV